jgi:HlyD family secretion protein
VLLSSKPKALRVPAEAVIENHKVLLLQDDGLLAERAFTPGLANWNYIEVLEGLQEGDKIVLSIGQDGVVAGAKARVKQ